MERASLLSLALKWYRASREAPADNTADLIQLQRKMWLLRIRAQMEDEREVGIANETRQERQANAWVCASLARLGMGNLNCRILKIRHASAHPSIHPSVPPSSHASVRLFVNPSVHPSIISLTHSPIIHPSIHPFAHSSAHPSSDVRTFISLVINPPSEFPCAAPLRFWSAYPVLLSQARYPRSISHLDFLPNDVNIDFPVQDNATGNPRSFQVHLADELVQEKSLGIDDSSVSPLETPEVLDGRFCTGAGVVCMLKVGISRIQFLDSSANLANGN